MSGPGWALHKCKLLLHHGCSRGCYWLIFKMLVLTWGGGELGGSGLHPTGLDLRVGSAAQSCAILSGLLHLSEALFPH